MKPVYDFSFNMSFTHFCRANDLPEHDRPPTPERPRGYPHAASLAAWRSAAEEAHGRLVKGVGFDPLVHFTGGFSRVERKYLRSENGAAP